MNLTGNSHVDIALPSKVVPILFNINPFYHNCTTFSKPIRLLKPSKTQDSVQHFGQLMRSHSPMLASMVPAGKVSTADSLGKNTEGGIQSSTHDFCPAGKWNSYKHDFGPARHIKYA